MQKFFLYFFVIIIFAFSYKENKGYLTLSGNLKNTKDGTCLYLRELKSYKLIDSIPVLNGTFSYKFNSAINTPYILHTKRNQYSFRDRKLIWLSSKNMTISGDYNFLQQLKIENSEAESMLNLCNKKLNYFANKIDSIKAINKSLEDKNDIDSAIIIVEHQAADSLSKFPKSFLNDYFITLLLYPPQYFYQTPLRTDNTLNIYKLLPMELKNIEYQKIFNKYAIMPFIPFASKEAPNISQPSPQGNIIRLSDLRGKYILIDFWASWCIPCRKSFVDLKKVYAKYKSLGFEIYSVSGDEKKDSWTKAIETDSIPWINVSDLKGMQNKAFLEYNVVGVPTNFLVDKNGFIIRQGFHDMKLLDDELNEILKNN